MLLPIYFSLLTGKHGVLEHIDKMGLASFSEKDQATLFFLCS